MAAGVHSASTGFLYDAGGDVPVCCTPEYLAAYGVGLDSTYGDGEVQGVLREDQAESAFMNMFPSQYESVKDASGVLSDLTDEIKEFALGLPEGTNLFNLTKGLETSNVDGDDNLNDEERKFLPQLQAIVDQLDSVIASHPELEGMLGSFFGEDTLEEEGTIGHMMVSTVLLGYDVENGDNGDDGANGRDDITIDAEDLDKLAAGEQPRVSLGEIVQWSLETNAYMGMYHEIGDGQSLAEFTQDIFTQVSEGTLPPQGIGSYSAEQIQVLVSVMMNNHSNLMSTTGNFSESGKNGAHEYLNNVGGGNRAFNMLHVGNLGTTGADDFNNDKFGDEDATGNANNEDLNEVVRKRTEDGAGTIFYAGDNGAGANGGFDDLRDDQDYIDDYKTSALGASDIVEDSTGIIFDDALQSELLADLTAMGAADPDGSFSGATIDIDGQDVHVSVENSEDFENEGYDVVVITLTDPATGAPIGSMTATEAQDMRGAPKLVEFGDKNGDGIVDQVGRDGLSLETFDADGVSVLEYATKGVDEDELAKDGKILVGNVIMDDNMMSQGLAMNESEDVFGEWTHDFEDSMIPNPKLSHANAEEDLLTGFDNRISGWDHYEASTHYVEDTEDMEDTEDTEDTETAAMNEFQRMMMLSRFASTDPMMLGGVGAMNPMGYSYFEPEMGMGYGGSNPYALGETAITSEEQETILVNALGYTDNGNGSYTDPVTGLLYYFDPTRQTLVTI